MVAECPWCGLAYRELRTGLTFKEVFAMLWSGSNDPADWRYKRRNTVLGKWHQIKREMWEEHLYVCEKQAEYELAEKLKDEVPF